MVYVDKFYWETLWEHIEVLSYAHKIHKYYGSSKHV